MLVCGVLLAAGMVLASLAALATGGAFIEVGKNNIFSAARVAQERPDVQFHTGGGRSGSSSGRGGSSGSTLEGAAVAAAAAVAVAVALPTPGGTCKGTCPVG